MIRWGKKHRFVFWAGETMLPTATTAWKLQKNQVYSDMWWQTKASTTATPTNSTNLCLWGHNHDKITRIKPARTTDLRPTKKKTTSTERCSIERQSPSESPKNQLDPSVGKSKPEIKCLCGRWATSTIQTSTRSWSQSQTSCRTSKARAKTAPSLESKRRSSEIDA